MAQSFKEKAHLNTNMKDYCENYDHIFKKKEEKLCERCDGTGYESYPAFIKYNDATHCSKCDGTGKELTSN